MIIHMYIQFDICGGDITGWGYLLRPGIQFGGKIQKNNKVYYINKKNNNNFNRCCSFVHVFFLFHI